MDLLCLCTVAAFFKIDDFGSGENDAQWLTSCSVSSSTLLLSEFSHRAQLSVSGFGFSKVRGFYIVTPVCVMMSCLRVTLMCRDASSRGEAIGVHGCVWLFIA